MRSLDVGGPAALIVVLLLLLPKWGEGQTPGATPFGDDERVGMHFVLVDEHTFGDAAAVVMSVAFGERVENVILVHERSAGPAILALAGRKLLGALEARGAGVGLDAPLTVGLDPDLADGPVPPWAEDAWRLLQGAGIGLIPGVGAYPVLTYGASARIIRFVPSPEPILRRPPG